MKALKIIFLIVLIFKVTNCEEKQVFYRCGVDDQKIKPIPIENVVHIKDDDRRLDDTDEFKNFNIYLDLINIKKDIEKFHLQQYESLFIDSLNKAVETLESLLKVKKLKRGFIFKDEDIESIKIPYWNKSMIGTNAIGNSKTLGIDLFIFGRFDDQMDELTLASAGPRYMDPSTLQPIVGVVNINTRVNYTKLKSKEYFQSIIIHEFTHILGFLESYFNDLHFIYNKTDEFGVVRYYIKSPKVLEVAKKYFDCQDIYGVELEESGGSGTVASHWEARILLGDYMNGVVYPEEQVISEFTLALLEDTGYYKPNYYTGGLMRYGKHKGCEFIKNRCVNSTHEINPKFENEFYDSILSPDLKDASCTSGRQSRTYYAWWLYSNLPAYYQYFSDPRYGGFSPADFCPVSMSLGEENENAYYTGHCSSKGNGGYGTGIIYRVNETTHNVTHYITRTKLYYYTSETLKDITGETYSDHSFCYQSSLIRNDFNFSSDIVRAICYESFCSNQSLTIKINNDYILCPRAGGKIEIEGYKGFFLCPDYNLICSGTVMCNDMFDCVDKKSKLKEDTYYYDYTIKTSQNVEDAELSDPDNKNNYELSDDGICPKNCKHCYENKRCIKCRDNFYFVGSKESQEISCLSEQELSKGYYRQNNIYYSCIPNCDLCSDSKYCFNCSVGYDYINNKCIKRIEHCYEYDDDGFCKFCENNYAFKENDRTFCFNKEESFNNYYTKDKGISYYPCQNNITSCSKCDYDTNQNIVICNLCSLNYSLYEYENRCIFMPILDATFYYLDNAQTRINKCSNAIQNCNECQNSNYCTKCKNHYFMINNDTNVCVNDSKIELDYYYLNNEKTTYYSCNNNLYQDVVNCKKCSSKRTCTLCQDNYTFINGDKSKCIEKNSLKQNYIQDPFDISNYIRCENRFNNCISCNNSMCFECTKEYIFINEDYSNCILKSSINLDYYITNDNKTYLSCKEEKYKNLEQCKDIISENPKETTINITNETINEPINEGINKTINITINKTINEPTYEVTNKIINELTNEVANESTNKTTNKTINETAIETPTKTTNLIINDKEPLFEIFILQVQIINKILKIFLTVSKKIEKGFHLKFSIDLYRKNKARNLEESYTTQEVDLYLSNDNEIESGNIASLSSEEIFDDSDRVVIKNEKNNEYEMKVLNNDDKFLDSQENKIMIQNKQIMDFSEEGIDPTINEYNIESSSKGCQFDLISDKQINENIKKITLIFSEKNNKKNNVNAECTLSSDNGNKIPCFLQPEVENKNYVLEDYKGYNENNLFYINQDKDETRFELNCHDEKPESKWFKTSTIIIIASAVVAVIILISACVCCCKKKKIENIPDSTFRRINYQGNPFNISSSARRVKLSNNYN